MGNLIIVSRENLLNTYKSNYYAQLAIDNYNNLLPFKVNPSIIKIVASLITDGFIDIKPMGNTLKYGYIGYFSKYDCELLKFNNIFNSIFKIKGEIKEWGVSHYGKSKGCIIISATIARILNLCGVPGGNKTVQEYNIPNWIIKANENNKSEFLRRIFSCEGSIDNYRQIRYSMYKLDTLSSNTINFLNDIRKMLSYFGIIACKPYINDQYIRERDNQLVIGYAINIKRKNSIMNFYKRIGFDIAYKQNKLFRTVQNF